MADADIDMNAVDENDNNNNNNNNRNRNRNRNERSMEPPTSSPADGLNFGAIGIAPAGAGGARAGVGGGGRRGPRPQMPVSNEVLEMQGLVIDEDGIMVRNQFTSFLNDFKDDSGRSYYIEQLDAMEEADSTLLIVDWLHLRPEFSEQMQNTVYQQLADSIQSEYYRFEPYLRQAIQNFVRQHKPALAQENDVNVGEIKEFYVSFRNFNDISQLRALTTQRIGQLCSFSATVTRTTEVRPELIYGTFQCTECGLAARNIKQQFKYDEPKRCLNNDCQNSKSWRLLVERSKFVDWQKVRAQELSSDIPPGSMPRSIDVILRGEIVEHTKPGDNSTFTGTLIVVPDVGSYYSKGTKVVNGRTSANGPNNAGVQGSSSSSGVTGLKALGVRELNYKLVFLANNVDFTNKNEKLMQENANRNNNNNNINLENENNVESPNVLASLSQDQQEKIMSMKSQTHIYEQLAHSIAPNIFGQEEVKRGILLMLFGGVKKNTKDGVKLRGDINVCIIGDPSTAKSQFLKYVTRILPRTVYTSGKASSAAGLTAAVMRDAETGEFGIEAGALMLADNGVCCIDEFDKMDELDQAAIHEAMEQQTITITKAGIQATLNARASILAAANPSYGRYDKSKPLKHNVNISAPIMSRFDLFFVIVDDCDVNTDYHVASHIVNLHMNKHSGSDGRQQQQHDSDNGNGQFDKEHRYSFEEIQTYIRVARSIRPQITEDAHKLLVRYYRTLRQRDQSEQKAYRITVRQLESLIRLSEALARVYCDNNVETRYVKEAARLLSKSIISVEEADIELLDQIEEEAAQVDGGTGAAAGSGSGADADSEMREAGGSGEAAQGDGIGGGDDDDDENEDEDKEAAKMSVSYNYYSQLTSLIVYHIRHLEKEVNEGITQGELENAIMNEKADICEEDELNLELRKLRMIVQRLIDIDHVLIIRKRGKTNHERVIMCHPNYDVDSRNNGVARSSQAKSRQQQQQAAASQEQEASTEASGSGAGDVAVAAAGAAGAATTEADDNENDNEEEEEDDDINNENDNTGNNNSNNNNNNNADDTAVTTSGKKGKGRGGQGRRRVARGGRRKTQE